MSRKAGDVDKFVIVIPKSTGSRMPVASYADGRKIDEWDELKELLEMISLERLSKLSEDEIAEIQHYVLFKMVWGFIMDLHRAQAEMGD